VSLKLVPPGHLTHAPGEQEHTLCGLSFDAHESGDWPDEIVFAQVGDYVTCPQCKAHIDFVRSCYRPRSYQLQNTTKGEVAT